MPAPGAPPARCGARARSAGRQCRCSAALLAALLFCLLPAPAVAKVVYTHLLRDDRSIIPIAPDFAFGARGRVEIELSEISIWQRHEETGGVDYYNFGVMLLPVVLGEESEINREVSQGECLLGGGGEPPLFKFDDPLVRKVIAGEAANATFQIDVENGGWDFLYFINCEEGAAVSFRARISEYNLKPDGGRDYLSIGETELDVLYWIMAALFAALSGAWLAVLWRRRECAHRVHHVMAALVVCKTLTLLAQAFMTARVEAVGEPHGWNVLYYMATTARGLLFFTVVILIGSGWSYMKPFMDDRTRKTLLVVIPLQVCANIALIFIDEESPAMRDWLTWRDLFHLVDIACCCAVLFPIVWQMKQLSEAAEIDGKAARSLAKLRLFRSFYITVVVFIYFTRIVVYLLKNTVDYRYAWTTDLANELAALVFYTWVGVAFRPHRENAYFKLEAEDIELADRA